MAESIIRVQIGVETIVVDESDAHLFEVGAWYIDKGYARRNMMGPNGQEKEYLHRLILGASEGVMVDHVDGDRRNNTRSNLRLCTHGENMVNRKIHRSNKCGLKGVYADRNKWRAQITVKGKQHHLGSFDTKELAHAAYLAAAERLHGEFARAG